MRSKRKSLTILLVVLVMLFTLFPTGNCSYATFDGLNIAIYADSGIDAETVTALCQAFDRMGHNPMAIAEGDLIHDRLTTANFDILVIPNAANEIVPSGSYGNQSEVNTTLDGNEDKIAAFVDAGGGLIAIGSAAALLCNNSINPALALYGANADNSTVAREAGTGMGQIHVCNAFSYYHPKFITYFDRGTCSFDLDQGADAIAHYEGTGPNSSDTNAIVGFEYGDGQVCLIGPELELEESSEQDLSAWDNIKNCFFDPDSELPLLAKIVEYVNLGYVLEDTVIAEPYNEGKRIAVFTQHDPVYGGSWPGFLPAVFRSIQAAGHTPIAITGNDIESGKLTTDNFDALVIPGGYAYGYTVWNYTSQWDQEVPIRAFVNSGGGIMGICAGAYYLSNTVNWEGTNYNYPVDLFTGTSIGPISGIAAWPGRALTPLLVEDTGLGLNYGEFTTTYYGGGYFDGGQSVTSSAKFDYNLEDAIIRFYHGAGRAVLIAPHLEAEEGYTNDWCWWDNYEYDSDYSQTDPESEWNLLIRYYDWITGNYMDASPLTGNGTKLGVKKGLYDTANDSIGDAQRWDSGGNKSSVEYCDGIYTVPSGTIMELEGFGTGSSGTINSVTLKVKYSVQSGSNTVSPVIWRLNDSYTTYATNIIPVGDDSDVVATYDLKAAGVDTLAELTKLNILYYNNDYSGHTTSFDYVQVIVN